MTVPDMFEREWWDIKLVAEKVAAAAWAAAIECYEKEGVAGWSISSDEYLRRAIQNELLSAIAEVKRKSK